MDADDASIVSTIGFLVTSKDRPPRHSFGSWQFIRYRFVLRADKLVNPPQVSPLRIHPFKNFGLLVVPDLALTIADDVDLFSFGFLMANHLRKAAININFVFQKDYTQLLSQLQRSEPANV